MNNGKLNTEALLAHCHGVFAKTSFIDVGTIEEPLPYNSKDILRDSYKNKQFVTTPPRLGRTMDTYFDKKCRPLQEDKPYLDRVKYAEAEPEKPKLGFYTADYSKRDEFTLTFRTEQYRSILRQEDKHARRALQQLPANEQDQGNTAAIEQKNVFLYDMVYDSSTGSGLMSRLKRDTWNPTALSPERQWGTLRSATLAAHAPLGRARPPEHGHRPVIETTFYRRNVAFLRD